MKSFSLNGVVFALWILSLAVARGDEPPVGFFNSYPAVVAGMDDAMPRSSPSLVTCIASGFSTVREEGKYDFTALDPQISYAADHQLPLSIISEINPLFSPPWLIQQARTAGQLVRNGYGSEGSIPSITSPLLRRAQEQLIEQVVRHLQQHDNGQAVRYIHPGAEWWFPYTDRYGEVDIEHFRQWLATRYKTIDALNQAWESAYTSFDQVRPPRLDVVGNFTGTELLRPVALDNGYQDCSWSTPQATDPRATVERDGIVQVTAGQRYTLGAWVKGKEVTGRGAYLELAWVGAQGGRPVSIDSSANLTACDRWQQLSVSAVAPRGAERAWPLLKFAGTGTVIFDDVELIVGDDPTNLAPNGDFEAGVESPEHWSFQNWTGGANAESAYLKLGGHNTGSCVRISVRLLDQAERGYRNDHAATYDWTMYWYETAAQYVNEMAALVKRQDRSRKTVSYLTYSFAFPAEWDYTQQNAIAPDMVARYGRDIDILGMQLCSADGDPYRATACLDIVRKYRKPMWVVDLVDFTSGVHIGLPTMEKVTQAVVAHGAEGIVYCGWHLTVVQDYSYWPEFSADDLQRMLTMAREGMKRTRGLRVAPEAALLHTMMPVSPTDDGAELNDFRSFMGWYKVLEAMHVTFDVVTLQELAHDATVLARYPYVIVPDCPHLPRACLGALRSYATSDRLLITMPRFARRDEFGRPFGEDQRSGCTRIEIPDHGRDYAGTMQRDRHAGNTPPLFLWRADTPATQDALSAAQQTLRDLLQQHGLAPRITLVQDDPQLRCVIWEGDRRTLIYLVNMNSETTQSNELVVSGLPPGRVLLTADMKPAACDASVENGAIRVPLPQFQTGCLLTVTSSDVE